MCETPSLGPLMAYCGHLGKQYVDKRLRESGYDVTPVQSRALMYLAHEGPVNQRDLERELHLRPSTVNGVVGRLEEKGCLIRRASRMDGRCRLVSLTDAGRDQVDAFRAALEEAEQRMFSCLSPAEREQLRGLIGRVIDNLENEVNQV